MKAPKEEEIPLYNKKTGTIDPLIFAHAAEQYLGGYDFYRLSNPAMSKERNEAKDLIVRRLVGIWGPENEKAIRAAADQWFNAVWQITSTMEDKNKKISWGDFVKRYGLSLLAVFTGLGPVAAAAPFILPEGSIPKMGGGTPEKRVTEQVTLPDVSVEKVGEREGLLRKGLKALRKIGGVIGGVPVETKRR